LSVDALQRRKIIIGISGIPAGRFIELRKVRT
jgi:hypothetical protein